MRTGQSSETLFTLQQWIPWDKYLANTKTGLMRMTTNSKDSLKRNNRNTRHTSVIPAHFLVRLPIQTCKTVQTRPRDMQDFWLSKKADEVQSFADRKDMKKIFDALKTVYSP